MTTRIEPLTGADGSHVCGRCLALHALEVATVLDADGLHRPTMAAMRELSRAFARCAGRLCGECLRQDSYALRAEFTRIAAIAGRK